MNAALRRMGLGRNDATSLGFRASTSLLLDQSGFWSPDAIEAELAHVGADEMRRTDHRGACRAERIRMAEWWAERIEGIPAGKPSGSKHKGRR